MSHIRLRWFVGLVLPLVSLSAASGEVRDDYELTVATAVEAMEGWRLYGESQLAGRFADGHYTDPNPRTKVHDFWSNGRTAKFDRDGNGHFETIFAVADGQLLYAGSIGRKGIVIDAARDYKAQLGRPVASLIDTLGK